MTKTSSICILVATVALVASSVWVLSRPKESDVYLSVLAPIASSSTVLTSKPSTCGISSGQVTGIPPELVANFLAANAPGAKSISLAELNGSFAIADSAKIDRYAHAGVSFQALVRGQQSLVRLSRVGFNSEHSEAPFCAEGLDGGLFHVRLQNGHWQFINFVSTWVS